LACFAFEVVSRAILYFFWSLSSPTVEICFEAMHDGISAKHRSLILHLEPDHQTQIEYCKQDKPGLLARQLEFRVWTVGQSEPKRDHDVHAKLFCKPDKSGCRPNRNPT